MIYGTTPVRVAFPNFIQQKNFAQTSLSFGRTTAPKYDKKINVAEVRELERKIRHRLNSGESIVSWKDITTHPQFRFVDTNQQSDDNRITMLMMAANAGLTDQVRDILLNENTKTYLISDTDDTAESLARCRKNYQIADMIKNWDMKSIKVLQELHDNSIL